ncbi:MAG TPA: acylneuraminate cytidylyltransferase family protein [Polyangia bacterium]|nr:acylneuraminate cytidylyltransferase family protein [Polyangia bacterium]
MSGMKHSSHSVAIVHARGGSRRIPFKNVKLLVGKPLVAWCIEAAKASGIDRVIVSTDHDGIAEAALAAGADVPFRRPADISEDVPSELVTQHGILFHERETGKKVDICVTIQPTTPFIRGSDMDSGLQMLESNPTFDSVISVGPVQHPPEWMYRRAASGALTSYRGVLIQGDMGVSQKLEPLFCPNGGFYATRRQTLFEKSLLIGERPGAVVMSRLRSVDIDDPIDFLLAEVVAAELAKNPDL